MAVNGVRAPLVLLALDAGDPDIVEREVRAGNLPTIAAVMQRGRWRRLSDPQQVLPYGSWVSLFSGLSHNDHGYFYFRQLTPGTYDLRKTYPSDASALPFWSYVRQQKIAVIDAPEITATLGGLPGIQLANWSTHQMDARRVPAVAEPTGLLADAQRIFGPQQYISDFELNATAHEQLDTYRKLMERIERKGALCRHLLSEDRFDLVVVGFFEAHTGAHRFWDHRPDAQPARVPPHVPELSDAVGELYRAIDRQFGRILEALPKNANVFVLSVYGMDSQYPTTGLMEAFCRELGYQAPAESAGPSLHPLALARRIIPDAWRVKISEHLPVEVQERLLADNFRSATNWAQTTAFALPSLYTGSLTVNLRDREPCGIVEAGQAYDEVLERLEADLAQLIDPHSGGTPILKVVRAGEIYHCDTRLAVPDLLVKWKSHNHFIAQIVHPRATLHQAKPYYFRSSYHSDCGFVAAMGPGAERWSADDRLALVDFAPTFLAMLGAPIPPHLPGRAIDALVAASG